MNYHFTALAVMNNVGQILGNLFVGFVQKYLSYSMLMLISQGAISLSFFYVLIFAKHAVAKQKENNIKKRHPGQYFSMTIKTMMKKRQGNKRLYIWILLFVSFTSGLHLYGLPLLLAVYTVYLGQFFFNIKDHWPLSQFKRVAKNSSTLSLCKNNCQL